MCVEDQAQYLLAFPQAPPTLVFKAGSLTEDGACPISLGWLARELQESACLCFLSAEALY